MTPTQKFHHCFTSTLSRSGTRVKVHTRTHECTHFCHEQVAKCNATQANAPTTSTRQTYTNHDRPTLCSGDYLVLSVLTFSSESGLLFFSSGFSSELPPPPSTAPRLLPVARDLGPQYGSGFC